MDFYSTPEVQPPRSRAAEEVLALRAKVGQLEKRLREESQLRHSLREQLSRRQAFMEKLAQAMPAALHFYTLADNTDTFLNDYLGQVLGYEPAALRQLKPRLLEALLHPHDKATLHGHHAQLHHAPVGTCAQFEARLLNAVGSWQQFRLQYTVARHDDQGRATHLLGALAAVPASEATPTQADLLADMSHEIKTPLHAIVGLAQLLRAQPLVPAQSDYLEALLANAENLLGIANSVLATQPASTTTPFDVVATVRRAAQSLAFAAQAKGLAWRLELPTQPLPTVLGDAACLTQILLNLLGNALKFTAAGSITITLVPGSYQNGQLELTLGVADTGIGISPGQAERIFERFAQASATTSQHYGGNGLGLAICQDLVGRQGGRLWLESEPGQGSRFYCTLVYPVSEAVEGLPVAEPAPLAVAPGLRVLLVDDNEAGALLGKTHLHAWQVVADVAPDGEQALALALARPYDLILLDIQLPGLSGPEVAAELRCQPGPNQATPIVALTADATSFAANPLATPEFVGWLEKPYTPAQLGQVLAQFVRYPSGGTSPSAQAYGFTKLGRLAHDAGFIRKMQQLFVQTVPPQLAQLEASITQQEWAVAQARLHSLKTTYGSLQIDEAVEKIKKIEEILKNNPTPFSLANLLHSLRLITTNMVEIFKKELTN